MRDVLHPPLSVIATWTPNYVDPTTRGPGIIVMVAVLQAACYITVFLRVWARLVPRFTFEWDDILIILNLLPLTGVAVCLCLGYQEYGFDRHVQDVPFRSTTKARQVVFAVYLLYMYSTAITKTSILLFNRRLTRGSLSPTFTRLIYLAIAFVWTYTVAIMVVIFTGCRPLNSFWNQVDFTWTMSHSYRCVNEPAVVVSAAAISMIQDFMVFLMPMVVFWKLNISFRQKAALTLLFSVGFLLCICGILRAYYTIRLYWFSWDMTGDAHPLWILTVLEMHLALICASGPALNHWFRNVLHVTWLGSLISSSIRRTKSSTKPATQSGSSYDLGVRAPPPSFAMSRSTKEVRMDEYSTFSEDEVGMAPRVKPHTWLDDDSGSASERECRDDYRSAF